MPKAKRLTTLIAASLLVVGISACASSREVVVGTDPGGSGTSGATQTTGQAVSTASITSELSRLVTTQKAYFEANDYYAADLGSLDFTPGSGVRVDLIQGDSDGFSAIAKSGDAECAVFVGDVRSPRGYASSPDVPACRN
jgi:hypothetical protein